MPWDVNTGFVTALSFVVDALTSILADYIGIMVAVFLTRAPSCRRRRRARTKGAQFNTAFRAGGVMGFSLCALSLMILYLLCLIYRHVLQIDGEVDYKHLFEYTAGYSLGGSTIAIGRVGGGTAETPGRDLNFCLSSKLQSCADNVSSREFRQPEQKAGCLIRSLLETPQ